MVLLLNTFLPCKPPDLGGSAVVDLADSGIEPANAAEARCEGYPAHRQAGFVEQLLGEVEALGLCHGAGCRPEMLNRTGAEMTRPYSQAFRKTFQSAVLETASPINRSARDTVFGVPRRAGVPGEHSGRHRRQGRNPASAAAAAVG